MTSAGFVPPMLVAEGPWHGGDGWAFEVKVDGQRLLAGNDGRLSLWSRSGDNVTTSFPELAQLVAQIPPGTLVDGEVAVFDEEGISRLALMRHRIGGLGTRRQQINYPVTFIVFDLLRLSGQDTIPLPYSERRGLLSALDLSGPNWRTPCYHLGKGEQLFAATERRGLEGMVAKRLDSPYLPGQRSRAWVKLKHRLDGRFKVVGWRRGPGRAVASILIGEREPGGALIYRGSVTNGISARNRVSLTDDLEAISGPPMHLDGNQPRRPYLPLAQGLAAIVAYQERTQAGWLRDASFVRFINEGDSG